jgi:hypothetical protein
MDGLSGTKVYQKFTINNEYLPSNYPTSLEFIVISTNHLIQDNKWVTQIESLSLPKSTTQSNLSVPGLTSVIASKSTDNNVLYQRGSIPLTLEETNLFLSDILKGIGITSPNIFQIQFMRIWRQHEGGQAAWNPFNTTLKLFGSTRYNFVPVRNYSRRDLGLQATIITLKNGRYGNVITAIKNIKTQTDINKAIEAVNVSPWGSKILPADYTAWKTFNNFIWKEPLVSKT